MGAEGIKSAGGRRECMRREARGAPNFSGLWVQVGGNRSDEVQAGGGGWECRRAASRDLGIETAGERSWSDGV